MSMLIRSAVLGVVTAVVATAVGAVEASSQATGRECVLICGEDAYGCMDGTHLAAWPVYGNGTNEYGAGSHGWCIEGRCMFEHPSCNWDTSVQVAIDLDQALKQKDPDDLRKLLVEFGDRLELDEVRLAVNVESCDGGRIAHLPMDEDTLRLNRRVSLEAARLASRAN